MPQNRTWRTIKAAVAASLVLHVAAVSAMAWARLAHSEPELLEVKHSPFAGQPIAFALSFARPDVKVPPPPDRPPVESPLLVTPDEARHAQHVYVDKAAAEVAMASTVPVPKVEVSELIVPEAPAAEREVIPSVKPPALARPSASLARHMRQRTPTTSAATVVPQSLGANDRRPARMHNNRPPRYPDIARQNRWEGTVLLKLSIDAKGRVTSVEVVRSSGFPILDAEAVTAVRQWQGEPATRDGVPVASEEYQPVLFRF